MGKVVTLVMVSSKLTLLTKLDRSLVTMTEVKVLIQANFLTVRNRLIKQVDSLGSALRPVLLK